MITIALLPNGQGWGGHTQPTLEFRWNENPPNQDLDTNTFLRYETQELVSNHRGFFQGSDYDWLLIEFWQKSTPELLAALEAAALKVLAAFEGKGLFVNNPDREARIKMGEVLDNA